MAAPPKVLLAKSKNTLSLVEHTRDVVGCAEVLFGLSSRWGAAWLRLFGVPAIEHERFILNLRVACWLHDLGKANEEFQAVVGGKRVKQNLRHEHLSALWIMTPSLRQWLASKPELNVDAICAAVLSHHIKAHDTPGNPSYWGQLSAGGVRVKLCGRHQDVVVLLGMLARDAQISQPAPALYSNDYSPSDAGWLGVLRVARRAARDFEEATGVGSGDLDASVRFMLALKLGLMVADAAGSASRRSKAPMTAWIEEVIGAALSIDDVTKIIDSKAEAICVQRGSFVPHPFQREAEQLADRALLLAGCGLGKTLAAWYWLRGVVGRHPGRIGRLLFLYPTRGTATEGFRDYVSWAPPDESALLHSTAGWDLERMAQNPEDAESAQGAALSEDMERLFALGHWPRRYFSATVDQFLSAMEHHYGAICRWPLLADAAVVIDEVHSFDHHMFEDLIAFLQHLHVPVLCMTATLSEDRREKLLKRGLALYPAVDSPAAQALKIEEMRERYRVRLGTADAARERVTSMSSGRVLWVVNTVAECQKEARQLRKLLGERAKVYCYHSRFKLKDRGDHHREVVEAFSADGAADSLIIAVTTQVCEMSLDLDADILVTALAPPSSLVQRMGRVNRKGTNPALGEVWIFKPESCAPYEARDIDAARAMLAALSIHEEETRLSQHHLAVALEAHATREAQVDGHARLTRAGFYAMPGDFRDAEAFTIPCVLDTEVAQVRAALAAQPRLPVDPFVVPVPRDMRPPKGSGSSWPSWLHVADSAFYTSEYGFERPAAGEEE